VTKSPGQPHRIGCSRHGVVFVAAISASLLTFLSIHDRGLCGHIEEVSVAKDQQGKKLGLRMITAIDSVAKNVGCYKTILDCSPENEPFYVKCGYHTSGAEMSHYFEEERDAYHRG